MKCEKKQPVIFEEVIVLYKFIDWFLFGDSEAQEGIDSNEKLWVYLPIIFGISVVIILKITI